MTFSNNFGYMVMSCQSYKKKQFFGVGTVIAIAISRVRLHYVLSFHDAR